MDWDTLEVDDLIVNMLMICLDDLFRQYSQVMIKLVANKFCALIIIFHFYSIFFLKK